MTRVQVAWLWVSAATVSTSCVGGHGADVVPVADGTIASAPAARSRNTHVGQTPHFASPYTYEWFVRAEWSRASGRLSDAIDAYRAAVSGADENPQLMSRLGSALVEAGDLPGAQRVLDDALEVDPESESVWLARAELCERQGQVDQAITALERAERTAPQSARAPLQLARLLRERGHAERAHAVLDRYRARSMPGGPDSQRAELEQALATGDATQIFAATRSYRLGAPPSAAGPLRRAAARLLEQARPALALRVLSLLPEPERAPGTELRALLAVGNVAALEAWLITHVADEPELRALVARAWLVLGRVEEAASIVESERVTQPGDPVLQLLAAEVALARLQFALAAELFAGIAGGTSVGVEARAGLGEALGALGLESLSGEVGGL